MAAPINKPLRGIRDSIPGGYVLGRTGNGNGPPILLPISNFATKGYVANTSIVVGGAAGGDLSGTYPNPTVSKLLGRTLNTTPPTTNQVMVWDGSDITWESQSGGVIIGAGAPSALEPAGTIYSRNDEARDYSSQPTTSPGTSVLQFAHSIWGSATATSATFGSAPTSGNLLVAAIASYNGGGALTAASGWTRLYDDNGTGAGNENRVSVFYKYAGAGESTTQTPTTGTPGSAAMQIWEIQDVTGTWSSDFKEEWHALNQVAHPSLTTAAHNTAAANQLILGFCAGDINWTSGNQGAAPTNAVNGQTDEGAQFNDTGTTSHQASIGSYKFIATSGTNYQLDTTYNANQEGASFQFISLNTAAGAPVAGWDELPLIDGATIVRSGTGVLSAAGFVPTALASSKILVGSAGGVATAVSMSGDATISNTGAIAVTKSGGVAFGSAAFTASSAYDAAGAAAIAQSNAETYASNASNLTSGTVAAARLPAPTASTLGGVESIAAAAHKFLTSISTAGAPAAAQPATTDLSDVSSGNWIPTDQSGAGLTIVTYDAEYQRVGNVVTVSCFFQMPVNSSALSAVIGGLPVTVANRQAGYAPAFGDFSGGGILFFATANTSNMSIQNATTNAAYTNAQLSGLSFRFVMSYFIV